MKKSFLCIMLMSCVLFSLWGCGEKTKPKDDYVPSVDIEILKKANITLATGREYDKDDLESIHVQEVDIEDFGDSFPIELKQNQVLLAIKGKTEMGVIIYDESDCRVAGSFQVIPKSKSKKKRTVGEVCDDLLETGVEPRIARYKSDDGEDCSILFWKLNGGWFFVEVQEDDLDHWSNWKYFGFYEIRDIDQFKYYNVSERLHTDMQDDS